MSEKKIPTQPEDMTAAANAVAQLLLSTPLSQRISEFKDLQTKNPVMYGLVKDRLKEIRRRAQS